jgi:capsid assembly protease
MKNALEINNVRDSAMREFVSRISRNPIWAILPHALNTFVAHGWQAYGWEAAKTSTRGSGKNKLAIIPVQGVLTKDGPAYWGNNYDTITDSVESAVLDPSVKRIVLDVDSPGGDVTGLPETAAVIAKAAKVKPVDAVVQGMAASAAYWLTSQANTVHLTPSGEVGSVGVRMMHVDMSKALENEGIKVTELYSGNFKTEWSPFHALSDEAIGDMQNRLSAAHNDFLTAVTEGRGIRATADTKAARFGEGRMFDAKQAYGMGLVDRIVSPREAYKALAQTAVEMEDTKITLPNTYRARLALIRAQAGY